MSDENLPSVPDIYAVHDDVVDWWDLSHTGTRAVLPDQTLQSILDTTNDADGSYVRGATLLRKLVSSHVFEDGNKRTAWVVTKAYLLEQGLAVEPSGEQIAEVMKHLNRYQIDELATWLETGDIDESQLRRSSDE